MAIFGLMGLLVAFAGVAVSVVCLIAGMIVRQRGSHSTGETILWGGHVAVVVAFVALTFCCVLLVVAFVSGDTSIEYVVKVSSKQTALMGPVFRISGLWECRE